ncbi:MAG: RDD family protein [Enhygromyxa sp.]
MSGNDNPYGLPPAPSSNPYPGSHARPPQPPNPFASPYAPHAQSGYAPPPGPPPSSAYNPYTPPGLGAQGPGWAQTMNHGQVLAEPGIRLVARILDGLLYFGVVALMGVTSLVLGDNPAAALGGLGMMALTVYQWYLLSTRGQTLGKQWMKVRVVKVDGSPVDFVSAVLLRNWAINALTLVGSLLVLGSVLPLVDALMIFGDERRCLHDHLAGTKVIVA